MIHNFKPDYSRLPRELNLLLDILKMKDDQKINQESLLNIHWDSFLKLARHHRIYPVIYPKIKNVGQENIPEFVIQTLKNDYKKNIFQMMYLSAEMESINELFNQSDVRLLFLKGPTLAVDLYGDISLRTSSDLDVLVPIHDLEKVDKLLLEKGYEKDDYILSVLNDWKWRHHHLTYFDQSKGIKLEIHWRLNPGPGIEPRFEDLWARKRICEKFDSPLFVLGREDLFLFLVSHGARHGWSRLRWLMDIHQILLKELDWKMLKNLLEKYHCTHLAGQALTLASSLLNTPINTKLQHIIRGNRPAKLAQITMFYLERLVNLHTEPLPTDIANYHSRYLYSIKSITQKIFYFLNFLYPYHSDSMIMPLPKGLHFLYFPLRPFLWIWRKSKRQALS
ncbi:nucleotidyltransferase domain-containing protein [Falsibacillus pallidus]|uniref:Putative nucleotidyltransferase-like protein n=1 Tax=Falsibacillus pallidus TaxID=493781 RepID=A0A370GQL4_9BACI|nr:nucleotidyltransferase family protein [Falsibacillus pallidus]RDI45699.1 putative nucleotidyltransferase-like protein [Falsibacillus pallidus]